MKLDELAKRVKPEWQDAFRTFVTTGDAGPEFLSYLDGDKNCQAAVDEAFTAQASSFEQFVRQIDLKEREAAAAPEPGVRAEKVVAAVTRALDPVKSLHSGVERQQVVRIAAMSLEREDKEILEELAHT